ncbi:hypothetical protein GQ600_6474 [Phytophthora cactorum]|nr:hypothetical protein GQ600_6474 [Phytophthora cactorum]
MRTDFVPKKHPSGISMRALISRIVRSQDAVVTNATAAKISITRRQELPPQLSETPAIQYISYTDAVELPSNMPRPSLGPMAIDLAETNTRSFWCWIDPFVENLDKIINGLATDFSVAFDQGYYQYMMNASETNWNILHKTIDCATLESIKFLLARGVLSTGCHCTCT